MLVNAVIKLIKLLKLFESREFRVTSETKWHAINADDADWNASDSFSNTVVNRIAMEDRLVNARRGTSWVLHVN